MRRLIFIFLFLLACTKPDETIYEETDPMVCVDCFDSFTHMAFLDAFCGSDCEADRFIAKTKETALAQGMNLYCVKH